MQSAANTKIISAGSDFLGPRPFAAERAVLSAEATDAEAKLGAAEEALAVRAQAAKG